MSEIVASLTECLKAAFPPVTPLLIREVVKEEPDFESIARIIGMDPALTAMVLTLVNAPYYGFSQKCTDLQRAAVVLGTHEILKLALAVSFHKALAPSGKNRRSAAADSFAGWRMIVWTAIAAELIAERLAPDKISLAYLCALLKDLSLLLMRCILPEALPGGGDMTRGGGQAAAEEKAFGMQHGALTQLLLAQWEIPADLCEGIRHHHDMQGLAEHQPYCRAIILATRWSELEHGPGRDPLALIRFELLLRAQLGIDEAGLEELRSRCVDRFRSMLQTLGIAEEEPDERLYRHSLQEMQRAYFLSMEVQETQGGIASLAATVFRQLRLNFGRTEAELCVYAPEGTSCTLYAMREGRVLPESTVLPVQDKVPWNLSGTTYRLAADGREGGAVRLAPGERGEADETSLGLYFRFLSSALARYLGSRALLERKALLLDQLPMAVARTDRAGRLLDGNEPLRALLGLSSLPTGTALLDLLAERLRIGREQVWRDFPSSPRRTISNIYCDESAEDGSRYRCLYLCAHKVAAAEGEEIVFLVEDVTEIGDLEAQALRERDFMAALLASMRDLVLTVDAAGTITYCSPRCEAALSGHNLFAISKPTGAYTGKWDASVLAEHPAPIEVQLTTGREGMLTLELIISRLGGDGQRAFLIVARDTGAVRRLEEKLKIQAMYDGLTGLLNHSQFQGVLERETQRSRRTGRSLGLVFMDMDGFKRINDHKGHQEGDAILRGLGRILRQHTRRGMDFPCRYGGDEFAVIFTEITPRQFAGLAARLEKMVAEAFGGEVGVSMGLAMLKPDESAEDILRRADRAAYAAKAQGGHRIVLAE